MQKFSIVRKREGDDEVQKEEEAFLIEKAKSGDICAFEELILCHEKIVYNIALRTLANAEDAKDISQEVWIKVYKSIQKFDGKSSFSTWVYRITMNTCIDQMRKKKGKETESLEEELEAQDNKMKKQFSDIAPSPEEQCLKKETADEILDALNELSQEHKTMITLRDLEGFSYTEITEITGFSLGTVKSRLSRARGQLKNLLLKRKELILLSERQNKQRGGENNEL